MLFASFSRKRRPSHHILSVESTLSKQNQCFLLLFLEKEESLKPIVFPQILEGFREDPSAKQNNVFLLLFLEKEENH
jgi:hypothetical protein